MTTVARCVRRFSAAVRGQSGRQRRRGWRQPPPPGLRCHRRAGDAGRPGRGDLCRGLADALAAVEVPAVADAPEKGDWRLAVPPDRRGSTVVPVYSIDDPAGVQQGTAEGPPCPPPPGRATPATLQQSAAEAAPRNRRPADQHRDRAPRSDPNSLPNRPAKVVVRRRYRRARRRRQSLTQQMRTHLASLGPGRAGPPRRRRLRGGQGQVATVPIAGRQQRVEIQWIDQQREGAGSRQGRAAQRDPRPARWTTTGATSRVVVAHRGGRRRERRDQAAEAPRGQVPRRPSPGAVQAIGSSWTGREPLLEGRVPPLRRPMSLDRPQHENRRLQRQPPARRGGRRQLNLPLTRASVRRFADMEVFVEIQENVRGEDVFVMQPTSFPANDNLMELLITLDALRRSSARRITAVIPYFGYARQDRKSGSRTPISAKLVANLITEAGAQPRADDGSARGADPGLLRHSRGQSVRRAAVQPRHPGAVTTGRDIMIVSPDVGGVVRARPIATRLNCDLAIIDKRRERRGHSEVMNVIGDVEGRDCILVDDIVDSGGTLCNAAAALIAEGREIGQRVCDARRAVGRRGGADCVIADRDDDDHRQHPGHRGGAARAQHAPDHRSRRCWRRRCGASAMRVRLVRCSIEGQDT